MDATVITELISSLGFPIFLVIVMGAFIFKIYKDTTAQNTKNMEEVQMRCAAREDKLYVQLEKQNEINGRFAEIIAQYDVKLDAIQTDIEVIKTDVTVLMNK